MKPYLLLFYCVFLGLSGGYCFGQDVALWEQFSGRYDFTIIGKTMNTQANLGNNNSPCIINSSSSATLTLQPTDVIEKAYLYWAGSGSGDFEIKLNETDIVPDRTFNVTQISDQVSRIFFSAFKDVTGLVSSTGNGPYTVSEFDLTAIIPNYCPNATNFAGWAIIIVYRNDALPLNQINVYDGLESIGNKIPITIVLDNLNVIDNDGAKIGFLSWEGDAGIADHEVLLLNGNPLSGPANLNPANNVFNGTNSITGDNMLFNMDIDVFDIQNYIVIGDSTAVIEMNSHQDFVMINAVVTKLNSQLPDATVSIEEVSMVCNSRLIIVDYTVYNLNSTDILPSGVPIGIYANDTYIEYDETVLPIPVGGSEVKSISLTIPDTIPNDFTLTIKADSNQLGIGEETELIETNNDFAIEISLLVSPSFNQPENLEACNEGFGKGTFDFSEYAALVKTDPAHEVSFFVNQADAVANINPILNTSEYGSDTTPAEIFIRIDDATCHSVTSFLLTVKNCPPKVYNFVSANNDGDNDYFFVEGLRNIFLDFKLEIYNRWGALIWSGNHGTEDWYGFSTQGTALMGNKVTEGTYFYILDLNDPGYPEALTGYIHLTR